MDQLSAATRTPVEPPVGAGRLILVLLCAAQFMLIVDVVIINVALPSIRDDLALPDGRLQLVSVSYTLTFGSLLVVFGRAADLLGRRRLFLVGLTTFTVASLATGLARDEWHLLVARAGQGTGAAMTAPTALACSPPASPPARCSWHAYRRTAHTSGTYCRQ